jgi:thiamine biosynthesis lipoprotein
MFAVHAMATRFELVLDGDDEVRLRAAAEEAFAEIVRLDAQLSFYRASSDITWINAHAAEERVTVEPRLFTLLERCLALSAATDGAFDITVAPLMKAWRFIGQSGAYPDAASLERARGLVGFRGVELDRATLTVSLAHPGTLLDLGSAGKGYAVDTAISRLRENGVQSALLHGGTSSVHTIGCRAPGHAWRVAWSSGDGPRHCFDLRDSALSVSASHGKAFRVGDHIFGHVIDPRSGWPANAARSAVVTGPHSLECEALSTALLVRGAEWLPTLRTEFPGYDGQIDAGLPGTAVATFQGRAIDTRRNHANHVPDL